MKTFSTKLVFGFTMLCQCLVVSDANCTNPTAFSGPLQATYWQLKDGLPQMSVQALAQTPDGYLWVGTQNGLARFDGVHFEAMDKAVSADLVDVGILSLTVSRNGDLWIGTSKGLLRMRGGTATLLNQIPRRFVTGIVEDRTGNVWVATEGEGVFRLREGTADHWNENHGLGSNFALAIALDGNSTPYVGTMKGIATLKGGKFVSVEIPLAINEWVSSVAFDSKGALLAGTPKGLYRRKRDRWTQLLDPAGAEPRNVIAIVPAGNGLLIGGQGAVHAVSPQSVSATALFRAKETVLSALHDRENNIWIGLAAGGLYRLTQKSVHMLEKADGLGDDHVISLLTDTSGITWVGTIAQLVRFDTSERPINEPMPDQLKGTCAIFEDHEKNIWMATYAGVFLAPGGNISRLSAISEPIPKVSCAIHRDAVGDLWIATTEGLVRITREHELSMADATGQANTRVTAFAPADAGALWLGTESGLKQMDLGASAMPASALFPNLLISSLSKEGSRLWIATRNDGVHLFDRGHTAHLSTTQGLPSNAVCGSQIDNNGNLWVSTTQGIREFRIPRPPRYSDGQLVMHAGALIDEADGMSTRECEGGIQFAVSKRLDGSLWFATLQGVAAFHPERVIRNLAPPPVVIEHFKVDGRSMPIDSRSMLLPGHHSLEFSYTATSLTAAEENLFQYRVDGIDDGWVDAGHRRVAYYMNLPAGDYTFRVKGSNNDGVWSVKDAVVDFSIGEQFYKTWWFHSLNALLAVLLIKVLLILRDREYLARQAVLSERLRLSRELHDKLSQTMTGVALQLDAAADIFGQEPHKAESHVCRAAQLARDGMEETRRTLQGLRPVELNCNDLREALHRNLLSLTAGTGTTVSVTSTGNSRLLTPRIELELFRIGQEAVANAIRHGQATTISVTLEFERRSVRFVVSDDGRGFDSSRISCFEGMGLRGIAARVKSLKGTVQIQSAMGSGTIIEVQVPAR